MKIIRQSIIGISVAPCLFLFYLSILMTAVSLTSCTEDDPEPVVVTDDKPFYYDRYIDESVRPGDDFFRYACGKWLDDTSIPTLCDQASQKMGEVTDQVLQESNDPLISTVRRLVSAAETNDTSGFKILKSRMDYLSAITTQEELLAAFSQLHQWGYTPLVRQSVYVSNGGVITPLIASEWPSSFLNYSLSLHDYDMLSDDMWDLCRRLQLFGFTEERIAEIHDNALIIEEIEMDLYDNDYLYRIVDHKPRTLTRSNNESNNLNIVCNLMGIGDLADHIVFNDNKIMQIIDILLDGSDESIALMRDYMILHVLGQDCDFVPRVEPYSPRLIETMKNATYHMCRVQAETVGEKILYKEKCREIMENLRNILIERISRLDWMSEATKQEALKKARQMTFLIGYPDQWNDEFTPVIKDTTLIEAACSLRKHSADCMHKIVGRLMETNGWDYWYNNIRFSIVNAFYSQENNQLLITPSFITAPFFDIGQSEATLYATAFVFAHEISHGFDAGGADFDGFGNRRNWWTDEDRVIFNQKQQRLITLYNQFEHYPGQPADGKKTLEENMADLEGVTLAYEAYSRHLKTQGFSDEQYDGQLKKFWISYAMTVASLDDARNLERIKWIYLYGDHSAPHNRVNGIVRLFDDWYRFFDVQPGDKLYLAPEDRVKIW